jgi:hypothetical protein
MTALIGSIPQLGSRDLLCGKGPDHYCLQHVLVHFLELLDVEAALAGRMVAEFCEQRRSDGARLLDQ